MTTSATSPVTFSIDYSDRKLDRLSSALRPLWAIPILAVLVSLVGFSYTAGDVDDGAHVVFQAGGLLFLPPLLMIVFRRRYPDWWFDWNVALLRLMNRVGAYLCLMDDRYPSTTDQQNVHLELHRPDAERDLNRWLPLVKWFLAIPHWVVLVILNVAALFAVIGAWFAILFTGRYPRGLFGFIEGVMRWEVRVIAYAFLLTTDEYPPFRLAQ